MEPITQQLEAIAKVDAGSGTPTVNPTETDSGVTAETVTKMVGEEIQKAMEPIAQKLEAIAKARGLSNNLNDGAGTEVKKGEEVHYMTGMF
jgi:hypothetical protein